MFLCLSSESTRLVCNRRLATPGYTQAARIVAAETAAADDTAVDDTVVDGTLAAAAVVVDDDDYVVCYCCWLSLPSRAAAADVAAADSRSRSLQKP